MPKALQQERSSDYCTSATTPFWAGCARKLQAKHFKRLQPKIFQSSRPMRCGVMSAQKTAHLAVVGHRQGKSSNCGICSGREGDANGKSAAASTTCRPTYPLLHGCTCAL